jgi:hypothetical protein
MIESSLEVTDNLAAVVASAPRVTLADIENAIAYRIDRNGWDMLPETIPVENTGSLNSLKVLSICLLVMKNGFIVIGKSAPASPENYSEDLGKQFAYEDGIRQLWPLMGHALRDRLWRDSDDAMQFHKATMP